MMNPILVLQDQLQQEADELLRTTAVMTFLKELGDPVQTGSSVTGLMVYPDIDFTVQNDHYDIQTAIKLVPRLFSELRATAVKVADFRRDDNEGAGYYLGFEVPFHGKTWHIDATVDRVGPIVTTPPELADWLASVTEQNRIDILTLKKALIDSNRYVGAKSQPPYTFRSAHLYEAVIKGGAKTIADLEDYFAKR